MRKPMQHPEQMLDEIFLGYCHSTGWKTARYGTKVLEPPGTSRNPQWLVQPMPCFVKRKEIEDAILKLENNPGNSDLTPCCGTKLEAEKGALIAWKQLLQEGD